VCVCIGISVEAVLYNILFMPHLRALENVTRTNEAPGRRAPKKEKTSIWSLDTRCLILSQKILEHIKIETKRIY
jgi:hypothetical protein